MSKLTSLVLATALLISTLVCVAPLVASAAGAAPAPSPAAAAPQYLLGTTLVIKSPTQFTAPPNGYWGDLLPVEYRFGICYVVDAINAARTARGESTLIDVTKYPINAGSETQVDNGWEYTIDFLGMQPADVDAALAKFPMTGVCAGLPHEYREVGTGYYSGDTTGDTVTMDVLGQKITLSTSDSFTAIREKLLAKLKAIFGNNASFDISVSIYQSANTNAANFNASASVYLNGAQPPMEEAEH
jgi:hypothetical protein